MSVKNKEKYSDSLKKFYENLAKKEDIEYYSNPTGISRKKKVIKMLSPAKNDIICDLGCGDGNLSSNIRKKVKAVIGVDFSQKRVKRARRKGINGVCADVHSTPFKLKSFDKVICSEVIEHVLDPLGVIVEINRILEPGGLVVLTVPLEENIKKVILEIPKNDIENMDFNLIKKKYSLEHCHLTSFSEDFLNKTLEKNGFKVSHSDYTGNYKPLFKNKEVYDIIYLIMLKTKITRCRIIELLFNNIIRLVYKKETAIRHIIICANKK